MHFSSLRKLSFPHIHRRKNSEKDAKGKGKEKPEPEATEVLNPDPFDPFTHHAHLPPTSIANLIMDPDNLTALYRASALEQAAHTPSSSSPSGSPNLDATLSLPHSTATESVLESKSPEEVNVVDSHSNLSTPLTSHHPVQSIADIVLNPVTLTALYETRNNGAKGSELSGPVV